MGDNPLSKPFTNFALKVGKFINNNKPDLEQAKALRNDIAGLAAFDIRLQRIITKESGELWTE